MTLFLLHNGQSSAERLARRVPQLIPITDVRAVSGADIVIRYGNVTESDQGFWMMNRKESLSSSASRVSMAKVLHKTGVRTPRSMRVQDVQWIRQYRVSVFNLQTIGCFKTEDKVVWLNRRIQQVQDSFQEVSMDADEQTRRVCWLAVRTLHALGLELGLVSIGVTPRGRLVVIDVAPTPVLKGRVLDQFATAVSEFVKIQDKLQGTSDSRLLLGTDLEFMFRSRHGNMVMASRYFPPQGYIGCDARSIGGDKGRRPLAELRPEPAGTPERLCQNIEHLLREASHTARHSLPRWVAGSAPFERFPLGGHIHFSGIPYTGRLVSLLDVYVGMPLMLIEDPTTTVRRRPKYGYLGDVRHKSYGGFEYRTPASFLVDPGIALGAFALAYTVAKHHQALPYLPLHHPDNMHAFYRSDRDHLFPLVEQAYENLSQTSTYQQYQHAIDPIFTMIRNDEVWDESIDIRTAWGIENTKNNTRRNRSVAV